MTVMSIDMFLGSRHQMSRAYISLSYPVCPPSDAHMVLQWKLLWGQGCLRWRHGRSFMPCPALFKTAQGCLTASLASAPDEWTTKTAAKSANYLHVFTSVNKSHLGQKRRGFCVSVHLQWYFLAPPPVARGITEQCMMTGIGGPKKILTAPIKIVITGVTPQLCLFFWFPQGRETQSSTPPGCRLLVVFVALCW